MLHFELYVPNCIPHRSRREDRFMDLTNRQTINRFSRNFSDLIIPYYEVLYPILGKQRKSQFETFKKQQQNKISASTIAVSKPHITHIRIIGSPYSLC